MFLTLTYSIRKRRTEKWQCFNLADYCEWGVKLFVCYLRIRIHGRQSLIYLAKRVTILLGIHFSRNESVSRYNLFCLVVPESGRAGVIERVPATGCATGDIMWLLDEPNQPYEG